MNTRKSSQRNRSLKSGRPPLASRNEQHTRSDNPSVSHVNARKKSSKATRKLINTHHQLQKSRAAALAAGNSSLVAELDQQINDLGGLEAYQAASLTGQDKERGGDSSEKLVEWLTEEGLISRHQVNQHPLRVLEVGALSSKNAISRMIGHGVECVRRLDLHSQEPGQIEEMDFMDLPVPANTAEKFDVVSLSLVLNYVPDPKGRGEMLRRTVGFLRRTEKDSVCLPCLFVVLPLPCLTNSRYMDRERFNEIMSELGYEMLKEHTSQKLQYMLFQHRERTEEEAKRVKELKKVEIRPGKNRNNFCITLEKSREVR